MAAVSRCRALWRWSLRWLRRMALILLACVLVLAGLYAWFRPSITTIGLAIANRAPSPFAFAATSLTRVSGDEWEAKDVVLRLRANQSEVLALDSLKVRGSWAELRAQRIREATLTGVRVKVGQPLLDALSSGSASSPSGSSPWSVGKLTLVGGEVALDLPGRPIGRVSVDAQLSDLRADGVARVTDEPQRVVLRNLQLRLTPEAEPFLDVPTISASFTWRDLLELNRIGGVEMVRPSLRYAAGVERAFASTDSPKSTGAPPEKAPRPFQIGELNVGGGAVHLEGLGAGIPAVQFALDALLKDVPLGMTGAVLTDSVQAVEVREGAMRLPETGGAEFLKVPAIRGRFTWRELIEQRRIASIRIEQPQLRFDQSVQRALSAGSAAPTSAQPASPATPYRVGELTLVGGKVRLDGLGIGIPAIEFGLATAFKDMVLSIEGEALRDTLQTIELHDIGLQSPVDPFTSVLTLKTIFIRFTPGGLWKREIEQVEIIHPVLNVGEDLFWYVDRVQQREVAEETGAVPSEPRPSWTIRRFDATAGQLVLAFDGKPRLPLPLPFESHAQGLNFDRLSELRLRLDLIIPEQDYLYPEYGLTLRRVAGRLEFSLPPERRENNLVHTLTIGEVQWKDYIARDLFLDVTFDEKAIHGELGGKAYAGYLRGAFDFGLDDATTWSGWVSGTRVDLKRFTGAFSPEKLSLTGPADFRGTVTARAREIQRFSGDFKMLGKGKMHIGKLDEIIRDLPPEWAALKRSLTRIGLETLRDFQYDTGHGDFRFLGREGLLRLDLRGPRGSRKIDAVFHDASIEPRRAVTTR